MRNLRKIAFIFIASIIILSVFNLSNAETGIVDTAAVRIREKASTDSEILTKAYEGEEIEILAEEGDWYKIKVNGKTGYASKSLIKIKEDDKETVNKVAANNTSDNNVSTYETPEVEENTNPKIVAKEDIYLKLLPIFSSNNIKLITKGEEVKINKELNNWVEVTVSDISGWMLKNKIGEPTEETEPEVEVEQTPEKQPEEKPEEKEPTNNTTNEVRNSKGTINVETANVREKADITSSIIAHLDEGDEVTIVEENGDWYKITNSKISTGYVSKQLVTLSDVTSRSTSETRIENQVTTASANGTAVVEFAKQYLGKPYVLGGKTPEEGFDCSGYTKYVFRNFGYTLGSVAASQNNVGTEVSKEELKEGDLILFYDEAKTKIGHTGIYIGSDQFIHAANPQRGVVIDSFSTNSYYSSRFVTARRIVE